MILRPLFWFLFVLGWLSFLLLLLCVDSESIDGVDSKRDSGSNDSEAVHNGAVTIFDAWHIGIDEIPDKTHWPLVYNALLFCFFFFVRTFAVIR